MPNPDVRLHQQLREQLWKGPAAVSAYLSVATQLIGITLSMPVSASVVSRSSCSVPYMANLNLKPQT
jgi:hypothetical protein